MITYTLSTVEFKFIYVDKRATCRIEHFCENKTYKMHEIDVSIFWTIPVHFQKYIDHFEEINHSSIDTKFYNVQTSIWIYLLITKTLFNNMA